MRTSDFDYDLPQHFIAQTPLEPRDSSRLLVLDRKQGEIRHTHFHQLGQYLRPGDLLILNETRVIPARLFGRKHPSGGRMELLLLHRQDDWTWEALVGGKGLRSGAQLRLDGGMEAEIVETLDGSRRVVRFADRIEPHLIQYGHTPLPPYIHQHLENPERYQTVYARQAGSSAAPTAGLHFTPALLQALQEQGVRLTWITLHVGLDTFAPVVEESPENHSIHTEWCTLSSEAAAVINQTRRDGGRLIAVGTTSVRTLESAARQACLEERRAESADVVAPYTGNTELFILPGYQFHAVDAMITNFHLPRSTLMMLVSAFASRESILNAYEVAKQQNYRFFSFGDAMFIV